MGRGVQTEPPVSIEFLKASFAVGANGGELLRRERPIDSGGYNAKFAGEPATYDSGEGLRVRLRVGGKRRTMTAARVAWAVHFGELPRGQVVTRDAPDDFRRENLALVPNCAHRPWETGGGQASSLARKAEVDASLLAALRDHEGASLAEIGKLAGVSEGRVSVKLGRLAERGLTESPRCCPSKAWALTDQGREIAASAMPVILDDLDQQVLTVLRAAAMGPVRLSRRLGVCQQTAKRRVRLLAGRGLVIADVRGFSSITEAGLAALGPGDALPSRWVRPEAVAASTARDVASRTYVDDSTAAQRSERARMARVAAEAAGGMTFGVRFVERVAS